MPDLGSSLVLLSAVFLGVASLSLGLWLLLTRHARRQAEGTTTAILDAAVDGVITIDANGLVETFNRAAEAIFGYSAEEVVGKNVKMLMPEPYHSDHDGYLAAYKATGRPKIIGIGREVIGRRKDGSTFPMDLAVGKSRDRGRPLYAGIVRDITARQQTEQQLRDSEARTRAIVETAADGIITIDPVGTILTVNSATERLFGYSAEEMLGQNVKMLMSEPYQSRHDGFLSAYRTTGQRKIIGIGREVEGRRKNGSLFPMELSVGEAVFGTSRIFTGIVRDITARKQTEQSLLDGEARTRAIVETAADGIITIDPDGTVLTVNSATERIFGYRAEEVVGQNVKMLMPEPFYSAHDGYLAGYRTTGQRKIIGIGREVEGRRKDGSIFPLELSVGEAVIGQSRIFTGIIRDITERRNAEEDLRQSEERFRLIVDNVRDYAITWLDVDGRIVSWNGGAERIYGWSANDVLGKPADTFYPSEAEAAAALREVRETGRYDGEGWRVRKDGARFWAHAVITPLWDDHGMMRGFVLVSRDFTEHKQVEVALQTAKEEAERAKDEAERAKDEAERAKDEAERAKDEAERANLAKSKFLAAASHDLRQPVQALVFFTEALESSAPGVLVSNLKMSLGALSSLLEGLLDVSRLDAGVVTPQDTSFSLSELLGRLVADATPLAGEKGITLKYVTTSAMVCTDPTLLGRVVQNLLSNAVKYTNQGRILVGCRRQDKRIRIEVWDTGIGIPKDRLDDVFLEFYQVGNSERDRTQGLGLGLAIVQRLTLLLGARLSVRSVEGKGSVFSVEMPVVGFDMLRNIAYLQGRPKGESRLGKPVIFIIDDELAVLRSLRVVIESWGYEVLTATMEEEAVTLLSRQTQPPDLIIADYRLRAGRTGAQAITRIWELFAHKIPSIIITGDTSPERLREVEAHGLTILHKPMQPAKLKAVIAESVA